jgi:TonB family protein
MKTTLSTLLVLLISVLFYSKAAAQQNDSDRIYIIVPQMPSFQGDLDSYMGSHLRYPQSAIDKGIAGTVNVTFVVTKTGDIRDVSVLSGVSPDVDSEAVRVVKSMPPWNPGIKNGKAVNVQYNLPVYFVLNNSNNPSDQNQFPEQRRSATIKPIDTVYIPRDGLFVDPYFGFGEGGPQSSTSTSINMGTNMKFGVGISYMFPSKIGISAGLQLQQYKFGYSYSDITPSSSYNNTATENRTTSNDTTVTAGYNETINYSFTYVQLPILCRFISSQENKAGFYAEAGIVVGYLISSQISGTATQTQYQLSQSPNTFWYTYNTTSSNNTSVSLTSQNPAKLTFAVHAAVGFLIPFSSKISLILDISPDIGIINAGDGSKDYVNFGTSKFYLFGNGNYGSFNSYTGEAKLLIKM